MGIPVHYVDVDRFGGPVPDALEKALHKNTDATMLALMYVNNETGAISDLPSLIKTARQRDGKPLHIHSDMVQALGKIPFALRDMDIDCPLVRAERFRADQAGFLKCGARGASLRMAGRRVAEKVRTVQFLKHTKLIQKEGRAGRPIKVESPALVQNLFRL